MNNKQEFYSNFQNYSKKNQRIAVFGRQLDENTLQIFELVCSKSDQFMKFVAKEAYDIWLNSNDMRVMHSHCYHPNVFTIPILEKDKPMFTFNEWCKNNYYKKAKRYLHKTFEVDCLEKAGEASIVIEKSAKRIYKMDRNS